MPYEPAWTDEVLGYATNFLAKHAWRVQPYLELDDLLQEAYLIFLQLVDRYDYRSPQHFMAMWKLALRNSMNDWSRQRSQRRQRYLTDEISAGLKAKDVDCQWDEEKWEERVNAAPSAVQRLIGVVQAGTRRRPRRRSRDGHRLTTNQYLCRFAGVPEHTPLRRLFERWLADV